ncbi:hypothetical protein PR048_018669 [Dryococelus australis]|uniref:Uncharacterized protein n=1 Tax=Dryococelus australis TaxID=614101 RepID=A0ABQ9HCX7_9NEOP|nr:hypothetical protein PR048_018669 [Dryococelus australis]
MLSVLQRHKRNTGRPRFVRAVRLEEVIRQRYDMPSTSTRSVAHQMCVPFNHVIDCGQMAAVSTAGRNNSQSTLGRGSLVVRLLASNLGEPGSIPGGVAPEYLHVEIVPDDVAGLWVFFFREPPVSFPFHSGPAPYSPRFTLIGSQDLDVQSRRNLSTHSFIHSDVSQTPARRCLKLESAPRCCSKADKLAICSRPAEDDIKGRQVRKGEHKLVPGNRLPPPPFSVFRRSTCSRLRSSNEGILLQLPNYVLSQVRCQGTFPADSGQANSCPPDRRLQLRMLNGADGIS